MIPVIKKELPLKCHAHRADDILTVIRIAKEYDIEVTLDHATDARCIVEQIKESGFPCICGPSFGHKTKFELKSKSFKTPGVLNKAGILVSIDINGLNFICRIKNILCTNDKDSIFTNFN